jgi:hypothetical protein
MRRWGYQRVCLLVVFLFCFEAELIGIPNNGIAIVYIFPVGVQSSRRGNADGAIFWCFAGFLM